MEKLGLPQCFPLKNVLKIDFEVTLDNEFFRCEVEIILYLPSHLKTFTKYLYQLL